MKTNRQLGLALVLALGFSFMIVINAYLQSKAENRALTKAVFTVA